MIIMRCDAEYVSRPPSEVITKKLKWMKKQLPQYRKDHTERGRTYQHHNNVLILSFYLVCYVAPQAP